MFILLQLDIYLISDIQITIKKIPIICSHGNWQGYAGFQHELLAWISSLLKTLREHASNVVLWVNTGAFRRIPRYKKGRTSRISRIRSPILFPMSWKLNTLMCVCVCVSVSVSVSVIVWFSIHRTELRSLQRTTSGLSMDRVEILVHIRYWCCLEAAVSQWKCC